jgi:hypothetical protein
MTWVLPTDGEGSNVAKQSDLDPATQRVGLSRNLHSKTPVLVVAFYLRNGPYRSSNPKIGLSSAAERADGVADLEYRKEE